MSGTTTKRWRTAEKREKTESDTKLDSYSSVRTKLPKNKTLASKRDKRTQKKIISTHHLLKKEGTETFRTDRGKKK